MQGNGIAYFAVDPKAHILLPKALVDLEVLARGARSGPFSTQQGNIVSILGSKIVNRDRMLSASSSHLY